jgi:hypothetical protein
MWQGRCSKTGIIAAASRKYCSEKPGRSKFGDGATPWRAYHCCRKAVKMCYLWHKRVVSNLGANELEGYRSVTLRHNEYARLERAAHHLSHCHSYSLPRLSRVLWRVSTAIIGHIEDYSSPVLSYLMHCNPLPPKRCINVAILYLFSNRHILL